MGWCLLTLAWIWLLLAVMQTRQGKRAEGKRNVRQYDRPRLTQSSRNFECDRAAACTGLDARAAAIVMRVVRNINQTGKAMAITIHQPGIHIFEVSCRAQHASAATMSRPGRWQIVCRVHSPLAQCRDSRPAVRSAFSLISHRIAFRQKDLSLLFSSPPGSTASTLCCQCTISSLACAQMFDELLLLKTGGRVIYAGPLGHESSSLIKYAHQQRPASALSWAISRSFCQLPAKAAEWSW